MGNIRTYWHIFWTECLDVFLEAIGPLIVGTRWLLGKNRK
jgi:hypothetical protein